MRKDSIIIGLALFSMFFGAGNLIFPPFLGMESGFEWPLGIACFIAVDVVLGCIGIYAMNAAGGALTSIEGVLGKFAGATLATVGVLCISALIAMPRTAATTYEMSIAPLFGDGIGLLPFSLVYFAAVFLLTFRQSHVLDIIGKFWTPTIVVGVLVIIVVGIVAPVGEVGAPLTDTVAQEGIKAGYQTMDILAAVGFAIIIQDTIIGRGYDRREDRLRIIARAGVIAAVLLTIIYSGLCYLGATAHSIGDGLGQAALIVAITRDLLGEPGVIGLGIIVGFACLTTAVGLIGSLASYFVRLTNGKWNYKVIVAIDCVIGVVICNLGLSTIVELADPILAVVCPAFMVTIVLLLFRRRIRSTWLYRGAAGCAFLASVIIAIHTYANIWSPVGMLPLMDIGFAWLPFAIAGGLIGWLLEMKLSKRVASA